MVWKKTSRPDIEIILLFKLPLCVFNSLRKLIGCFVSPSWKLYSMLPSTWFAEVLSMELKKESWYLHYLLHSNNCTKQIWNDNECLSAYVKTELLGSNGSALGSFRSVFNWRRKQRFSFINRNNITAHCVHFFSKLFKC